MDRIVYADNAATTKISKEVLDTMLPYLQENYGNPSSLYKIGREAATAISNARKEVAKYLNADEKEVYFTGSGSESINWAITNIAKLYKSKGTHIISSKYEHHAVLHTLQSLEKQGYRVTYLDVYEDGIVRPEDVRKAITDETILITIMYANNEIGTVNDIKEIGRIAKEAGVLFHTDAVQAAGHVKIDVKDQNIDMLSISGHKFHSPKGVGALYCKKGIKLSNFIEGGGQERGKRAGTENVASIVGMAKALQLACDNMEQNNKRLTAMTEKLIEGVLKIPYTRLNGHRTKRMAHTANFSIEFIEGESILLMLDLNGIYASSGSACTSGSLDPSHVLLAIGLKHEVAHGSLRISLSDDNTEEDIDYILEVLPKIVDKLRAMSPVYNK